MNTTAPKPFVFVLMPFDHKFEDIYHLGIKPACANAGAYAERVDEQIFTEGILDRIYNQIAKADIIVSDMTGQNPNVFYETGYAHALDKIVILLTQKPEDIPFDMEHYPHIIYGGDIAKKLLPELEKKVRWAIDHQQNKSKRKIQTMSYTIDGHILSDNPVIEKSISFHDISPGRTDVYSSALLIIHNTSEFDEQDIEISIASPRDVYLETLSQQEEIERRVQWLRISDDEVVNKIHGMFSIYPGAVDGWDLVLGFDIGKFSDLSEAQSTFPRIYQMSIHEHSRINFNVIPFRIKLNIKE